MRNWPKTEGGNALIAEQTGARKSVGKSTYSVEEVREILGISRRKAYDLCNSDIFKVIRVGRALRISKASFVHWLDGCEQNGGE